MIKKFESVGYVDTETLFGACFDWTTIPTGEWIGDLKNLIEYAYAKNNNSQVVLIAHSMGCPYSYYFLMKMGAEWMSKYLYMYVPMAPAWMGSPKALDMMLEGLDRDLPIAGKYFAPLFRHLPCVWFLFPVAEAYTGQILAYSPSKTYRYDQIKDLLNDGNASYVDGKLRSTQGKFLSDIKYYDEVPNIPVHIFLSHGKDTLISLKFDKDITPHQPDESWESCTRILGDGDETVPTSSLRYVSDKWINEKKATNVDVHDYEGRSHVGLIQDDTVIKDVLNLFYNN